MGTCCAEIHMMKLRKNYGSSANSFSRSETRKNVVLYVGYTNTNTIYDIRYTIRGDSFFANLVRLISDEPNKIQGCSTTGFGDNDLNCVVG